MINTSLVIISVLLALLLAGGIGAAIFFLVRPQKTEPAKEPAFTQNPDGENDHFNSLGIKIPSYAGEDPNISRRADDFLNNNPASVTISEDGNPFVTNAESSEPTEPMVMLGDPKIADQSREIHWPDHLNIF